MSFVNRVDTVKATPKQQKPVATTIAAFIMNVNDVTAFGIEALSWPDSYVVVVEHQIGDTVCGWVSYTARGANSHDIKDRFEKTGLDITWAAMGRTESE